MPTNLVTEYLLASGVSAIAVVKTETNYTIAMGRYATQIEDPAATVYWLEGKFAAKTARLARKNITHSMVQEEVDRELHAAAARFHARLTPNNIVMSRATVAAQRLALYLDNMNAVGGMAEFNQEYKKRRHRATARGERFMSLSVARSRLRRVLIRLLIEKKELDIPEKFFDEVFERKSK